ATTGTPTSFTINLVQNGVANTPFISPFTRFDVFIRGTVPGSSPYAGTTTAYTLIGSFGGASVSISTTSSTITNSFTVTPGVSGVGAFPSSTPFSLDLLVVASNAQGYSTGFVIPTVSIAP